MQDPAALVASAFAAAVCRDGLVADPSLRLMAGVGPDLAPPEEVPGDPFELGPLHERLLGPGERSQRGAWYTPRWLAEDLVARAFRAAEPAMADGSPTVADPACGGGVFLLAAAARLAERCSPAEAVERLWGCDVDPLAVAVAEAALWWWSARLGQPTVAGERVLVGDALTVTSIPHVDVVVGNPPFLGQLRTVTAAGRQRREELRCRFGDCVRPYTDPAWLFLVAAVDAVGPGGTVALVQPSSLLAARDASSVRDRIDDTATLVETWIDDGTAFDASVEACAPVLRCGSGTANAWTQALAAARGVPPVHLAGTARLGDMAVVVAGFRDEYYGLVDAVREAGDGPMLVTAGAIDPLRLRTDTTIRFAKQRWQHPTVDADRIHGRAARWVACQARPKVLVATQTRVLEGVVDSHGQLVGSVPVIAMIPEHEADLWRLAAAVHAPVVSAWMVRRCAGTALSTDACKPTTALLSELPQPLDRAAWDEAAELAELIAGGVDRWERFAVAADRSYGVDDPAVRDWWLRRLPVR